MKIAPLSPKQSRMVVAGVMLGLFLGAMEATVVATALPTIAAKLQNLSLYSWPMAIYILAAAVSGPIFGKLSDLYGRKSVYFFSLTTFLVGSALSGFAQNMYQLIAFRALQGLGAGGVLPLAIIIAGDIFPLEKRAKVQPLFSAVWGIASLVGPPLGILLTSISWRWVFFVNIPFGILSGWIIARHLIEVPEQAPGVRIDYTGGILLVLGLLAFEIALPEEGGVSFTGWRLALLAASMVLLAFFVLNERKAEEPILPLNLLKFRIFTSASLCQFLMGMALFGVLPFIPLYAEMVMGKGIAGAGAILTWLLFFWVIFSVLASRLMLRSYRFLVVTGTFMVTAGFLILAALTQSATSFEIDLAVTIVGAGMGWIMAPLMVAVQTGVPRKNLGIATSALVLFRTAGASIGVSVMGSIMVVRMKSYAASLLNGTIAPSMHEKLLAVFKNPNQLMDPALRMRLPADVLHAARSTMAFSLHGVFMLALVAAAFSVLAGFLVPGGKAEEHVYREPASAKQEAAEFS